MIIIHKTRNCCKKRFMIEDKDLYVYKRGNTEIKYYCSWSCFQKARPVKENCTCTDCMLGYKCTEIKRKRDREYHNRNRETIRKRMRERYHKKKRSVEDEHKNG